MKKQFLVGLIVVVAVCVAMLLLMVLWPKQGLRRTSLAEHKVAIFKEAGFQVEIPTETPFVSSSFAGALIMVHEIRRGFRAETGYLMKVHVMRKAKASMDDSVEFASKTGDVIQQWRYRMHSHLDVRKTAGLWYVRKDIETPEGEFLSVDGELMVTEFVETDLSEIRRIIESIKLIPK